MGASEPGASKLTREMHFISSISISIYIYLYCKFSGLTRRWSRGEDPTGDPQPEGGGAGDPMQKGGPAGDPPPEERAPITHLHKIDP